MTGKTDKQRYVKMDWQIAPLLELAKSFEGPAWEAAVREAGRVNEWFTPGQIDRAVAAIGDRMLTPAALEKWLSRYRLPENGLAKRIGIVMAGNLPLVGLADLAAVIVTGNRAVVKPSSKDRPLMEYVVQTLQQHGAAVELSGELAKGHPNAVIATGSDSTRRLFEQQYTDLPTLLRGNRQSIAVLTGQETDAEIQGLAEDLFAYWGMGCRSVTRLFVPAGYAIGKLAAPLQAYPIEPHESYRNCYRYARAMAGMSGGAWTDGGFFVLRQVPSASTEAAPVLAEVLYSEYRSPEEVNAWLHEQEHRLQCLTTSASWVVFPRTVGLGEAQRPGWTDYADGVDTLQFLLDL